MVLLMFFYSEYVIGWWNKATVTVNRPGISEVIAQATSVNLDNGTPKPVRGRNKLVSPTALFLEQQTLNPSACATTFVFYLIILLTVTD